MAAQPEQVIYESDHVTVGHRLAVAVGAGVAVFATMYFLRWGWRPVGPDHRGLLTGAALAGVVALALAVAALRSRVVWRVTLDPAAGTLRIDRDPAAVERWALADILEVRAVPVVGGWSRDPAERLVLRLRDGSEREFALPDDALTSGIVGDIRKAQSGGAVEAGEDVAKDAAGGVAGAGEVREQGVEGGALGAVAVPEAPGDGDRRGG